MKEYIFDGEIHEINENFSYIIEKIDVTENVETLSEIQDRFYKKYSKYIYENEKDHCLDIILKYLYDQTFVSEDYKLIYRPKWEVAGFTQSGNFCLKFKSKKVKND